MGRSSIAPLYNPLSTLIASLYKCSDKAAVSEASITTPHHGLPLYYYWILSIPRYVQAELDFHKIISHL